MLKKIQMKNTRSKKIAPIFYNLLHHRWAIIITIIICAGISAVARYTFHIESYSDSTFMGLASGFGVMAAIWLVYSMRLK